jgi:hypothetical protein
MIKTKGISTWWMRLRCENSEDNKNSRLRKFAGRARNRSGFQLVILVDPPDSVELNEVGLDADVRKAFRKQVSGSKQFAAVMFGLGIAIAVEMSQAAIGRAIGVAHHQHSFGLVQANGHSNLFENEVLLEVVAWRSQRLGSSGDNNHVGALDALLLQKLSHRHADAMIEAA